MAWVLSVENSIFWSSTIEGAPKIRTTQENRNDGVRIDGKNIEKVLGQRPSLQKEQMVSVKLQTNVLEKSLQSSSHLEKHQTLSDNPKSIHTKNSEANSNTPFMVRTIKKGDTLSKLITTVYGSSNPERVKWILNHNPHIHSPKKMFPGQDIFFPKISQEVEKME
jgi:nucleoid-associated protein YgaU